MRSFMAFLIVAASIVGGCFCALAGGPMGANGTAPYKYASSAFPLTYKTDRGGLGAFSNTTATGIADYAFQRWGGVSSAAVSFSNGGQLARDVNSANDAYISGTNQFSDGVNPVVFDSSGAITDSKLGVGAKSAVLGFASSASNGTGLVEGYVIINGFLTGSGTTSDQDLYKATITHEVGHFLGLSHSPISMHGDFATMYPSVMKTAQKNLSPDDTVSIVRLYPPSGWASRVGTISGTVKRPNNAILSGVNVLAMDSVTGTTYSTVVDYFSGNNTTTFNNRPTATGAYSLAGLPPGTYFVRIEPMDAAFSGGSLVASYSTPVNTTVAREWYNGANEGGDMLTDNTNEKVGVRVTANSTTSNIDFVANESSTLSSITNDNGTPYTLMPLPNSPVTKYAVKFTAPSNGSLLGVKFRLEGQNSNLPLNGTLTITVHANASGGLAGVPGTVLGSLTIPFSDLESQEENEIWLRGLGTSVNFNSGDSFHISFSTNGVGLLGLFGDNGTPASNRSSYYTASGGWQNFPQGYPSGTPAFNVMVTAVYSSSVAGNPQPAVTLSPTSLDFGRVRPGNNADRTITVSNTGTATLNVTATSILGRDSANFSIIANGGSFSLANGASRTLTLRFAPAVAGGAKSATLSVISNAATSPNTVPLQGAAVAPAASKLVTALNFGPRRAGGTYQVGFAILRNVGNDTLHITSTALTGADAGTALLLLGGTGPKILAPDSTDSVSIRFLPTQRRTYNATLTITHDDTAGTTAFAVSGTGIAPVFATASDTISVGDVRVGTSGNSTFYRLRNDGDAPMIVSGLALLGADSSFFQIVSPVQSALPITVAPGDSLGVQLRFAPNQRRAFTARLQILHDAAGNPTSRVIVGRGVAPRLSVAPVLTIPPVRVGGWNTGTISLLNSGEVLLSISGMEIVGPDAAEFTIVSPTTFPATIDPSGTLNAGVRFDPKTPGSPTATLRIFSDDPALPTVEVQLNTMAIQGALTVTPATVDFGDVQVATTGDRTVDLTNTGTDTLTIATATVAGGEFSLVGAPIDGTMLAPDQKASLTVRFAPATAGAKSGLLSIMADVSTVPITTPLKGTGVLAGLTLSRSGIDFGTVKTGVSRIDSFVVRNSGNAAIDNVTMQVSGASGAAFGTDAPATAIVLQPGESRTVHVTLKPQQSAGALTASVLVQGAGGISRQVDLSAFVVSGVIGSITEIDFGSRRASDAPFDTTFVVRNTGGTPFTITGITATGSRSDGMAAAYFQVITPTPVQVAANDSAVMMLRFNPFASGDGYKVPGFTGTLTIATSSQIDPFWSIALRGEVMAPAAVRSDVIQAAGLALSMPAVTPNPARGSVEITIAANGLGSSPISLSVVDLTGRRVLDCYDGTITGGGTSSARRVTVDVSSLPAGSYQIVLSMPEGSIARQLVVVR